MNHSAGNGRSKQGVSMTDVGDWVLAKDDGPRTTEHGPPLLRTENLSKTFRSGAEEVVVLDELSLEVNAGEFIALVGESGSGKTTLLHLLAALDTQTKGEVYFDGRRLSGFREDERALYRNEKIGFVWQMHYLLPEFSALENVVIPQLALPAPCNAVWVNYREGSSSEWPWPEPWRIGRRFCWQMSQREAWTIARPSA